MGPNTFNSDCVVVTHWFFQHGDQRHLEFTSGVNFGHMTYFQWWLTTSMQNIINVSESAAELLRYVTKLKMAAAAILIYYFIILDHPRSLHVEKMLHFNFRVDQL